MKKQKILQYDKNGNFIRSWDSIAEVTRRLNLKSHGNIISCCNQRPSVNTAYGYIWRYYTDDHPVKIEPAAKMGEKFKKIYGVDGTEHEKILEKRRVTNINKYGVDHHMKSPEIIDRWKSTNIEKYGVDNPAKNSEIRLKISRTEKISKIKKLLNRFPELSFCGFDEDGLLIFSGSCGHEFKINRQLLIVRNNKNNTICTECNRPDSNQISEIENYLTDLITDKFNISVERNVKGLTETKHEIDILLPSNVGIEVNGIKYHNDIYRPDNYHLQKTEMFASAGYRLIHFFDDEISEKSNIIMSMIGNILGVSEKKHGRSCKVGCVSTGQAADFLETNHMQGKTGSTVRLGLFYEDELMSLMTFSNSRKALSGDGSKWELVRFCNKMGVSVVGGASKLFKYFVKKYDPVEVISYANRRWSEGNLYKKLDFEFDGFTKPGYWYFYKNRRVHRYALRKDVLVEMGYDERLSEREIIESMNIPRIYDCGNFRFIWRR